MTEHDIAGFAGGLSARLASRSRHVCVFLGAGTSKSCGLPDIATLQSKILGELDASDANILRRLLETRNLEQALSRIRRISAVAAGEDVVDGLSGPAANDLDQKICAQVIKQLTVAATDTGPVDKFSAWVARADYFRPLEIFTVNYDLLVEAGLEKLKVPYFDGFVGYLNGRFRSDLVEADPLDPTNGIPAFFSRVWKLHGSLNWKQGDAGQQTEVVRLGAAVSDGSVAAIYPSDTKYEDSRRMPFVVLQDRLRRALAEPETLMLVSGYSWSDDHLNEHFFDAATRRPRSEVIAFCYDAIPPKLAKYAALTPNLQVIARDEAIIGGVRGPWKTPALDLPEDLWKGSGVPLGDFGALASFLARGTSPTQPLSPALASAAISTDVNVGV
jgi:hypothetical protein